MAGQRKALLNQQVRGRINALLTEHDLTQAALARAANERQQDVNRFCTGDMVNPSLDFLDGLARVFQHTLADLLAAELPKPSLRGEEVSLLAVWNSIDRADQRAIWRLLRRGAHASDTPSIQTEEAVRRRGGRRA